MATARVFKSGNSQAVRLPKEFRFGTKEVEIFRRGDEVVMREKPRSLARAFEIMANIPLNLEAIEELKREPQQDRDFGYESAKPKKDTRKSKSAS